MNILVGYIPTPEGLAALDWATEPASLTDAEVTAARPSRSCWTLRARSWR